MRAESEVRPPPKSVCNGSTTVASQSSVWRDVADVLDVAVVALAKRRDQARRHAQDLERVEGGRLDVSREPVLDHDQRQGCALDRQLQRHDVGDVGDAERQQRDLGLDAHAGRVKRKNSKMSTHMTVTVRDSSGPTRSSGRIAAWSPAFHAFHAPNTQSPAIESCTVHQRIWLGPIFMPGSIDGCIYPTSLR